MSDPVDQTIEVSDDDKRPSYETHQRLLSETKAAREKAKKLEDELSTFRQRFTDLDNEKADAERKRLEDKEQFKDLYAKTREELLAKETMISNLVKAQVDARKMSSFLDAVKADVPRQYWGLVDIDKIALDGEKVDEYSVQKYVEEFRTSYADILKPKETRKMPGDMPPTDDNGKLTYEQWLKLPAKEQEKKINLVK